MADVSESVMVAHRFQLRWIEGDLFTIAHKAVAVPLGAAAVDVLPKPRGRGQIEVIGPASTTREQALAECRRKLMALVLAKVAEWGQSDYDAIDEPEFEPAAWSDVYGWRDGPAA